MPLVPSVRTLLAMVAMPPVNSTMQVVLDDGVNVRGVEVAAMVAEVVDHIVVLSWLLEQLTASLLQRVRVKKNGPCENECRC